MNAVRIKARQESSWHSVIMPAVRESCFGIYAASCVTIILLGVSLATFAFVNHVSYSREVAKADSKGTLTLVVYRMMSMYLFDDRAPDLHLEVQFGKEVQTSGVFVKRSEARAMLTFSFYDVGWHDAILFRLKDVFPSHRPNRGILALTPSEMVFDLQRIYRMSPETNWLVIEFHWDENGL